MESEIENLEVKTLDLLVKKGEKFVEFADIELKVKVRDGKVVEVMDDVDEESVYQKEDAFRAFLEPFFAARIQVTYEPWEVTGDAGVLADDSLPASFDQDGNLSIKKEELNRAIGEGGLVIWVDGDGDLEVRVD
jgi:hypothetical protein